MAIFLVALFLFLSTGSVIGAVYFKFRYEQCIAVWIMSVVLVLYIFGLVGILIIGFYFLLLISFLTYAIAITYICKNKVAVIKEFCNNYFSPGFFVWLLAYIGIIFINYGRLCCIFDEFSHWATVVKQMCIIDALGTDPKALAVIYKSYPPGMALFQYFVQKFYFLVSGNTLFTDWLLHLSFQLFSLSFIAFFWNHLDFHRYSSVIIAILSAYAPMLFFTDFYTTIYIDSFVGIASGAGLASLIYREGKNEILWSAFTFLCCSILTLAKDVGLLFSLIIAIAYALNKINIHSPRTFLYGCLPFFFTILPKVGWELSIKFNNVPKCFSAPIDFQSLLNVISGKEDSYRKIVLERFIQQVFIDQSCTLILLFVLLLLVFLRYNNLYPESKRQHLRLSIIIALQLTVYLSGMCILYMYRFFEYEALELASLHRYISIAFTSISIYWFCSFCTTMQDGRIRNNIIITLCLLISFYVVPYYGIYELLTRQFVASSINKREQYSGLCELIENNTPETSKIYFLCRHEDELDHLVCQYNLITRQIQSTRSLTMGKSFYEGDIWSTKKTPSEFQNELKDNYDYIILYYTDDYFLENYSHMFSSPADIKSSGIYSIDKASGMLSLCN